MKNLMLDNKNHNFANTEISNNTSFVESSSSSSTQVHHYNQNTFKPIGPYIDSIHDNSGEKFSDKYEILPEMDKPNIGFYGRSRMTR